MSFPVYGRYQAPQAPPTLEGLHLYTGAVLKQVDHEPPIGVLDQSDLTKQGIDTASLVLGAKKLDALGSCTQNANTSALSNLLEEAKFLQTSGASSYQDTVGLEKFSILNYSACTHMTANPATEWPPTDCGSSGVFVDQYDRAKGWCSGEQVAAGARNLVSLLQGSGVLMGSPWFYAWEQPDHHGFIDGDGSSSALQRALASGVAGGHETYLSAIEKLVITETGVIDAHKSVLRIRNSWSPSWGDHGSCRLHLSTLMALGSYCDFRRPV